MQNESSKSTRASISLNLYGREAVRRKVKQAKNAFFVFLPVLELTADSLTIEVEPQFFGHFDFFCFIPMKISQSFLGSEDGSKF